MAENLSHRGINVTIVDTQKQVMASFDYEMAQFIHKEMTEKGVKLMLGHSVTEFKEEGKLIITKSGKQLKTDMIILAVGVKGNIKLAKESNLKLGETGNILVDEYLKTSDEDISACGDEIEVNHVLTNEKVIIPLAWPANRQGRLIADHINGYDVKYRGSLGTNVAKVFDFIVASTGLNERQLNKLEIEYEAIHINRNNHANYYPNSHPIIYKILFGVKDGLIYGAQGIGRDGVEKRIELIATSSSYGGTVIELYDIELCYAPPFGNAKFPVNILGYVSSNILSGDYKNTQLVEIEDIIKNGHLLLDVRTPDEYDLGHIEGSVNMYVDSIRHNYKTLPKDKPIYLNCQVGNRGYIAAKMLKHNGFNNVYNLSGGYKVYSTAVTDFTEKEIGLIPKAKEVKNVGDIKETIYIDACGLQCPGPIMETKKALEGLKDNDILKIEASDSGFMKDIESWARKTNNTLIDVKMEKDNVVAYVMKGTNEETIKTVDDGRNDTTLVCFSGDLDKVIAGLIIANGAAAMGHRVSIFFTFWGINVLRRHSSPKLKKSTIEHMFGWMMPKGAKKLEISKLNMMGIGTKLMKNIMKKKNVFSTEQLLHQALENNVKFIACTMSMDVMGIKKEELIDGIDYGGVATYICEAQDSNITLFI